MVMEKSNIKVIANNHLENRDLLLDKLLKYNGVSQAELAKALSLPIKTWNSFLQPSNTSHF